VGHRYAVANGNGQIRVEEWKRSGQNRDAGMGIRVDRWRRSGQKRRLEATQAGKIAREHTSCEPASCYGVTLLVCQVQLTALALNSITAVSISGGAFWVFEPWGLFSSQAVLRGKLLCTCCPLVSRHGGQQEQLQSSHVQKTALLLGHTAREHELC